MEKLKCPSVNWYPESFLAGTRRMTDEEVGIYVRALNYQFTEGGIVPDEYETFPEKVKKKFILKDGLYINERMEFEQKRKQKYSQSRANNRKYYGYSKEEWESMTTDERVAITLKEK